LAVACAGWLGSVQAARATQVDLSQPGGDASGAQLAADPAGDAVAVWSWRDPSGASVIQAAVRPALSSGYTSVGKLSGADVHATDPQVAVNEVGNAVAVWRDFKQGHADVEAAAVHRDGTIIPQGQISDLGVEAEAASVAVAPHGNVAGDAIAVWQQSSGGEVSVHAAERTAGATFVSLGQVSTPMTGEDDENPQVAIDRAGDAIIVWQHYDGTNFVIQAAVRPAGAANFTVLDHPVSVPSNQPQQDAFDPQVAVDPSGDAVAVWTKREESTSDEIVQVARLAHGAASFAAPQTLSAAGQQSETPQVAVDATGDAVAAWERFDTTGTTFVGIASLTAGASTPDAADFAAGAVVATPDLASDPAGDAVAVWSGADGTNSAIFSSFRPPGGAFQNPFALSTRGQNATEPQVALDQAGEVIAVWERSDGHNKIATAYLPTPPPGPGPPVPTPLPPPGGCTPHPGLPCPPGQPQPQPPKLTLLRLTSGTISTAGRLVHGHCAPLRLANRSRRPCTRPATLTVSFTLPAPAAVTLSLKHAVPGRLSHGRCLTITAPRRHGPACTRRIALRGQTTRQGHAGANTFRYKRWLGPGRYRLLATPTSAAGTGTTVTALFEVVR
jgi:hypothetical protein